jgi:OmpA-OmpF porin, OOP family
MKIKYFIFLLIFMMGCSLHAQNLVPNPSFEDARGRRQSMFPWQMINTIDYFVYDENNKQQLLKTKIKDKNFKLRKPRSGTAYVGMRVWPRYSEFLVVELLQILEKDKNYMFEMYVALSPHSTAYLRSMGVSFYSFKAPYSQKEAVRDFPPQVEVYKHHGIKSDKIEEWIRIVGVFTAKGGERFMTIGNYSVTNRDKFKPRFFSLRKREAYYYIDDIALYMLDEFGYPIKDVSVDSTEITEYQSVFDLDYFDDVDFNQIVHFPEGSSDLTYEAYTKLGAIVQTLLKQESLEIHIIGHAGMTDSGSSMELSRLAKRRARTVSVFISGNRINRHRLHLYYSTNLCGKKSNLGDAELSCSFVEILFSNDEMDMKRVRSGIYSSFQ